MRDDAVVRDNTVRGHRSPPTHYSNFDGAITVGVDAADPNCGCRRTAAKGSSKLKPAGCCFGSVRSAITSVVVEGNTIIVNTHNGSCAKNGLRIFADHTIERGNVCREV